MSMSIVPTARQDGAAQVLTRGRPLGARIARHLLKRLSEGHLSLTLPDGTVTETPEGRGGPRAVLIVHRWRAMTSFLISGDVGLAEAYLRGDWDTPDRVALITLGALNERRGHALRGWTPVRLLQTIAHARNRNTRRGSRRNIEAHYDLGNAFYEKWLDRGMSYSSALYADSTQPLEAAQIAKQDRVLSLLDLPKPADVLEIGCGWGALAARIAEQGHRVTGVTLSHEQLAYTRDRLAEAGLEVQCDIRLQDYREISEQFDAVVSIEMFEAVGVQYWETYFQSLWACLKPGGTALLQVITISEERYVNYRKTPDFIQLHIFPGGMLPSVPALRREIAAAGLVLDHEEYFGLSYARTLAEWASRFEIAWPDIAAMRFSEEFRRKWRFYLAYCEAGFRTGALDVGLFRMTRPL